MTEATSIEAGCEALGNHRFTEESPSISLSCRRCGTALAILQFSNANSLLPADDGHHRRNVCARFSRNL
jgi:hypothetical protein